MDMVMPVAENRRWKGDSGGKNEGLNGEEDTRSWGGHERGKEEKAEGGEDKEEE